MEMGRKSVKETFYRHIFITEFNLGFQIPKKDRCNDCEEYKTADKNNALSNNNELITKYKKHLASK